MVTPPEAMSLLIVDDHAMLADGIASYLAHAPDIEVTGIAGTGQQALKLLAERAAEVVLLDFRLPDTTGDELAKSILLRWPASKILMITANDDDDVVVRAINAGCQGFLPKGRTGAELLAALRAVHAGQAVFDPATLARALSRLRHDSDRRVGDDLTPRELEVLQLLASGLSTKAIAVELRLRPATVRNHVQNTLTKLNAHSQLEAVAFAVRHGIVDSR